MEIAADSRGRNAKGGGLGKAVLGIA